MEFYISYFYQIRFFTPNMIPISTCISDPAWFHLPKDKESTYFDKNGVINGLRCEELAPGPLCQGLCNGSGNCSPTNCEFLKAYSLQLQNYFNFNDFIDRCNRIVNLLNIDNPKIVLIVYETPNNPCSERQTIIQYFKQHNIELKEWSYEKGCVN